MPVPYKYSPAVLATVIRSVERGMPPPLAAEAVGICRETFTSWIRMGEDSTHENFEIFKTLKGDVAAAEAKFIESRVENLRTVHAGKDPRADIFLLERRSPENFAPKQEVKVDVDVSGKVSHIIDTGLCNMLMDQWKAIGTNAQLQDANIVEADVVKVNTALPDAVKPTESLT